ncbi:MAG TPA: ribonuclease III, partial [Stellaceae bacterium]|nr:ribonuclease III [Stellaceae bacterium]
PAVPRRELTAEPQAIQSAGEDPARLVGHVFARPELLAEALTHPSVPSAPRRAAGRKRSRRGGPAPQHNYERLEFLGDRVLGLVIADLLWRRFQNEPEGDLTSRLADLVRRDALARVALEIGLDRHLRLSPTEAAAGAARNPAILADVCEAVIAAVYLDGGFAAAFAVVERFWEPLIAEMKAPPRAPKTALQEWTQGRGLALPAYEVVATTGPAHALNFTVLARVGDVAEATGSASSKRAAETAAAAALLETLLQKKKSKA